MLWNFCISWVLHWITSGYGVGTERNLCNFDDMSFNMFAYIIISNLKMEPSDCFEFFYFDLKWDKIKQLAFAIKKWIL